MARVLVSLLIGVVVGLGLGLYLGWVQFPAEYINSPASALAERYKDDYTLMIAGGYLQDGDIGGAVERLRILGVPNIPAYVQATTERFITTSREPGDISLLVALAEGMGRLTPIMEPYRQLSPQTAP